jgi:membrane associated rhomboid family serine protease
MNYRTARMPVVTFSLMALNILVWLVSTVCFFNTDGDSEIWIHHHLWLAPAFSPWSAWLTSMFVHAGFFHLAGNMIFLFLFGCCVEDMIGRGRFLLFYLLGGFVSALFFFLTSPLHFASHIPLGGASGAISACMGMFLWLRADVEIEFLYFYWFLGIHGGRFEVPAWMAIGFWFLKDFAWMILSIMYPHFLGGGVAFGAHVGGLLAGLGLVALFRLSGKKAEDDDAPILSTREIVAAATRKTMGLPARTVSPTSAPAPVFETPTIYLDEEGVQTGPHTLSQIQTRLAKKELAADSRYWSEGMSQWESIQDLADNPMS